MNLEKHFIRQLALENQIPPIKGMGIGDDAAFLRTELLKSHLIIATDTMSEGIHFRYDFMDVNSVIRKLVESNVSDLYAKGSLPCYALFNASFRSAPGKAQKIQASISHALKRHNVVLIGGDTTGAIKDHFSLTVLGENDHFITRRSSMICEGDILVCSGPVGGSTFALQQLLDGHWPPEQILKYYKYPEAENNAPHLLKSMNARASIDQSDSVIETLERLCDNTPYGLRVYLDRIPIPSALGNLTDDEQALLKLIAAEDYRVFAIIPPTAENKLRVLGLFPIGEVTDIAGIVDYVDTSDEIIQEARNLLYSHF